MDFHYHRCSHCQHVFGHEVPDLSHLPAGAEKTQAYSDWHDCPKCRTGPHLAICDAQGNILLADPLRTTPLPALTRQEENDLLALAVVLLLDGLLDSPRKPPKRAERQSW